MKNMNFRPNDNFLYYLYWINERMNIFWKRYNGEPGPWTTDPILRDHKFTNVYRVLDRSSQYLVSNVIYNGNTYTEEDMFWRIMVYKHFNLPATWDWVVNDIGDISSCTDFKDISFSVKRFSELGNPPYSNAYMMTAAFLSGDNGKYNYLKGKGKKKHELYFHIFEKEIKGTLFISDLLKSKDFSDLFNKLKGVTSMADFLSYQIAQDLNYSELFDFNMNKFNAAGPGTIRGIQRTFEIKGKINYGNVPVWVYENFDRLVEEYSNKFDVDLKPDLIPGLPLQVPDLSNSFCETDKYMRGSGIETEGVTVSGDRIKQKYTSPTNLPKLSFPPKWNVTLK